MSARENRADDDNIMQFSAGTSGQYQNTYRSKGLPIESHSIAAQELKYKGVILVGYID